GAQMGYRFSPMFTVDSALQLYRKPLFELIFEAHSIHREHHDENHVQKCSLLSIKTGGCPEDCSYCPQSAHYKTGLKRESLMDLKEVEAALEDAKAQGAERFCMGAAWREINDGPQFDQVLQMVRMVKSAGMEACVTLGMLTPDQARRLKEAGVDAYNHNLDTSREFYDKIISTRTYDDRLNTLKNVREAGMTICSGGILGLGESDRDRCAMLVELANLKPQPESVPINLLIPVEGTPLAENQSVDIFDLVRTIAVARILMPKSRVRLSAGRINLTREGQALAFFAGANSIFLGEKLLTRDNPTATEDENLLSTLGLKMLDHENSATAH
ncbi:MAG: biotin synthase BioB, partial [Bdellovibrionales bacterium]|nr:biotin synthase BioB [Bdellovibrionales bacterium]